ncbi:MAG: DUF1080 domain-containing protein [Planctomycetia bacterium]|nr:DUF1080 domain-containing protein [Planctomycetia bacterium]
MKKLNLFVFLIGALALSLSTVMAGEAKPLFGDKLQDADYNPAVWSMNDKGELSANKDAAIWTKVKYGDCKISMEYKLSKKANAGLLIQCSDKKNWIPNTIEIQLLDDAGSEPNYHGNCAFYGYQAPSKVLTKPAGEWNKVVVSISGRKITVELNGEIVNKIDTSEWKDCKKGPAGTDIEKKFQGKALADADPAGYIGLQGLHGKSSIVYRNLTLETK